ncbi:MAG TPA: head GIN domain-containing protein [Allosphingosinicella sp.]|nr:head GIN domain-containing protein [Allosphingosinicella sp.]
MRGIFILTASALGLALAACSAGAREGEGDGEHRTARRDFQVGEFRSVSLTGSPDVVVTVGGAASVRAEGDARLVERLDIRVEDGDLKIGYRERSAWSFGLHRDRNVTIHVTVPALAAATLTGSGDMRIDRVQGDRFVGTVTGSGDLQVGRLQTNEAVFTLTGSGGIRAAGTAQRSHVELAGSGDVNLGGLEIRDAVVSLHGSGDIIANATEAARVTLMGSGDVAITGAARCQIDKRGSGEVTCAAQG